MKPVVNLRLLGPFGVLLNGTPIDTDRWQRRPGALLRLLGISRDFQRPRDEVIDLLWPESDGSAGASNLRYTVHLLRRYLSPHAAPVKSRPGWIMLAPDYLWEVDLLHFEEAAQAAAADPSRLTEAAALYTGEPLPDDRYNDWATPIRDRIVRSWESVCELLAADALGRGAVQEAVRWYEKLLADNPLNERAMQGLLEVLHDLGRGGEALQRYSEFERLYREELDDNPGQELASIVEQLYLQRHSSIAPGIPPAGVRELVPSYPLPIAGGFVGRQLELDEIISLLPGESGEGSLPRLVVLLAEAGMGKTWLAGETARVARARNMLVLAGGSYEQEGRLPYGPVHDALLDYIRALPPTALTQQLENIAADLSLLLPELSLSFSLPVDAPGLDPEARRLRLFATVAELMQRIAAERPLLLIADDLHWSDEETIHLLHYLARQPSLERVLIVGTCRQDEVSRTGALQHLLSAGTVHGGPIRSIPLAPMSDDDLAAVLTDRLEQPCSATLLQTLRERSGSNPLFAVQIARMLQQEGRLQAAPDGWQVDADEPVDVPIAVRDVISRRLRKTPLEYRAVLGYGAVLGREFSYANLEAMHPTEEAQLWAALDHGLDASILAETPDGYTFRHPLLREVLYGLIPTGQRSLLHARAGIALERLDSGRSTSAPSQLAYHFMEAGKAYAARAVRYAVLAGDQAARSFAYGQATQHYRDALRVIEQHMADCTEPDQLMEQAPSLQSEVLTKLGAALTVQGNHTEALAALESAATVLDARGDTEAAGYAVAQIGIIHSRRGTHKAGEARVRACLGSWPTDAPSRALAELLITLSTLTYWGRLLEPGTATEPALRARQVAEELNDSSLRARADEQVALALLIAGKREEGTRLLAATLPALEENGEVASVLNSLLALSQGSFFAGRLQEHMGYLLRGLTLAREYGDPVHTAVFLAGFGRHSFYTGQWDHVAGYSDEAVVLAQQTQGSQFEGYARTLAPTVRMLRGERGALDEVIESIRLSESLGDATSGGYVISWVATVDLLKGQFGSAITRLEQLRGRLDPGSLAMALSTLAYAYLRAGDLSSAASCIAEARALISDRLQVDAELQRAEALVAFRSGSQAEGLRLMQSAIEQTRDLSHPFGEARFLYDLGTMYAEASQLEAADDAFARSLRLFEELRAVPFIRHVRRARRAARRDSRH